MNKKLIGVDLGGIIVKLVILIKEGDIEEKWIIDINIEDKGVYIVKNIGDFIN